MITLDKGFRSYYQSLAFLGLKGKTPQRNELFPQPSLINSVIYYKHE